MSATAAGLALLRTAKGAHGLLSWLTDRQTKNFEKVHRETFDMWIAELAAAAGQGEKLWGQLKLSVEELEARVALLEGAEAQRVFDNYAIEAQREAIDERRRMLAYAAAGSGPSGLSIAELARVERMLRELDPADVLALPSVPVLPLPASEVESLTEVEPYEALLSCGCIRTDYGGGAGSGDDARRTSLGGALLVVMRLYIDVRRREAGEAPLSWPL